MDRKTTKNQWQFFKHTEDEQIVLKPTILRIVSNVVEEGLAQSYFESEAESEDFRQELEFILSTDRATFYTTTSQSADYSSGGSGRRNLQETSKPLRIKNSLMEAVNTDENSDDRPEIIKANQLFSQIFSDSSDANYPSVVFTDNVNRWHPTPESGSSGTINYLQGQTYLPDCAETGADINLLKYLNNNGSFDHKAFRYTVELMCTALEIIINYRGYDNEESAQLTYRHRPLSIGFTNLAAILMAQGIAYDSDEARAQAATIAALMTGQAYLTSTRLAEIFGPFAAFHKNRGHALSIIQSHRNHLSDISASLVSEDLLTVTTETWEKTIEASKTHGLRHAQVTSLGSGYVQFETDKNKTNGSTPFNPSSHNSLFVQDVLDRSLKVFGYDTDQIAEIKNYIEVKKTTNNLPYLKKEHIQVIDDFLGNCSTNYNSQLYMMSMIQPFVSGSIASPITLSLPLSIKDAQDLYILAWKRGLKLLSTTYVQAVSSENLIKQPVAPDQQQLEITSPTNRNISLTHEKNIVLPQINRAKVLPVNFNNTSGYIVVCEDEHNLPKMLLIKLLTTNLTDIKFADSVIDLINLGLRRGILLSDYIELIGREDKGEDNTEDSLIIYLLKILREHYLSGDTAAL